MVTEIDEIRAGEWDNRIRAQLSGGNPIDELPEPSPAEPDIQPPQVSAIFHCLLQEPHSTTQVLAEEITQEEGTPQPEDMILEPESSPEAPVCAFSWMLCDPVIHPLINLGQSDRGGAGDIGC